MSTATTSLLVLALAAPPAGEGADAAAGATDLSAARAEAEAARKAAPSAATWAREAEACERLADLACAREARAQQKALAPEGSKERAEAEKKLAVLGDMSRGTVGDEPASTRRAENDRRREKPVPKIIKPAPTVDKPVAQVKHEPIIKKWYFWVTVIAIAASGAAITAIAVDSARDEQKGAAPITEPARASLGPGGFGLRF